MVHPGLVSVTFRGLTPRAIVALVQRAGLRGIEWGGDIHVPHGDLARARETRALTRDAGLTVAAYGSYYRAAQSETNGLPFARVLETAVELDAPTIRVWAGPVASVAAAPAVRRQVADDLRRIAHRASAAKRTISLEFHNNTLTDTAESAAQLLAEVAHPNVFTYWQPPLDLDTAGCIAGLRLVAPKLTHLHVYHWRPASVDRLPLADGAERWQQFLAVAQSLPGERYAMLEFVEHDAPESFLRDAATLREWLKS